jgi:hypothetical protein
MKIRIFFYRYKIGRDAVFARYCSKSLFSKGEAVFRVPFSHYEASRKSERALISLRQFSSGGEELIMRGVNGKSLLINLV